MLMEKLKIKTIPRTVTGKKARHLRREGLIPAEFYGKGKENIRLAVQEKEFEKIYKEAGENTLVYLDLDGSDKEPTPAFIAEIQRHPTSLRLLSIDLHGVKMDEEIQASVPIVFTGEAPGVKAGFVLVTVNDELEIEALPQDVPHTITVDISGLKEPGDVVKVLDVSVPSGVKILALDDMVIALIGDKASEETPVAVPAAAEVPAEGDEKKDNKREGGEDDKKNLKK